MNFGALSASRWSVEASFRVGEFSTGTMGNFRLELTARPSAVLEGGGPSRPPCSSRAFETLSY